MMVWHAGGNLPVASPEFHIALMRKFVDVPAYTGPATPTLKINKRVPRISTFCSNLDFEQPRCLL